MLLMKGNTEANPAEFYSLLLCVCLYLWKFSNNFAGRVTKSLSFCCIIGRSFAKVAVVSIISGLDNSVLIHRFFFKNSYITCGYFSNILSNHYLLQYYGLAFTFDTKLMWVHAAFSDDYSSVTALLITM